MKEFDYSRSYIHTIPLIAKNHTYYIDIKRDDLIHPYVSGNKWRKLEPYANQAQIEGYKGIATMGGAFSNHLVAVACACAHLGIQSIGYVRGEIPKPLNHMLFMCNLFGMKLIPVTRGDYPNLSDNVSLHRGFLWVEEGGKGIASEENVGNMLLEIPDVYDLIVCAMGTGTTCNGIAKGILKNHYQAKAVGIPVLKGWQETPNHAEKTVLYTEFHQGGYGKTPNHLLDFIRLQAQNTGIYFDPIYTGKALYAVKELFENGTFETDKRVLFVHTGGNLGGLSEKIIERFNWEDSPLR